jgi:uncharacterized protein (TIGR00299 family) protein
MKTAYFDLIAGASGDMILGALIDSGLDVGWLRSELGKLPISEWELQTQRVDKNGFTAIKVDVVVGPQPHARPLPEIERVIRESTLTESVKRRSLEVVRIIAAEEAKIHGMPIEEVHLHEVGGEDAIIDICGSIAAVEHLGIERIECSPFPLGRGFINGAHGQIPLPAPAAVGIMKGLPITLKHLSSRFGNLPSMLLESVGYGAGSWNLVIPNLLRVFIGQADTATFDTDIVSILETNIDDQNPEHYEHLMERMFDAGALDVTMTPTHMKKNRPGVVLSVISKPQDKEAMRSLILTETSSLGVREKDLQRSLLNRDRIEVDTPFGKTFVKVAHLPGGAHKYAPEFEDCRRLARVANVPLREVYVAAETAARYVHEHSQGHQHKH